jgi:N-acetylglucosamine-6-phosphate deacetylase
MTALAFRNGRILADGDVLDAAVIHCDGDRIAAVAAQDRGKAAFDLAGGWLLPGFVDLQVNGGGGVLFNADLSVAALRTIAATHARHGTTTLLPTLITDTPEAMAAALDTVDAAIAAGVPGIAGLHIEGPFINARRKGVHDPALIRPLAPELVELVCRPRRGVVMLTVAPEQVAAGQLRQLAAAGVVLSAGHSDASFEQAAAGFAAGIGAVTHLYNAMSPLQHRAPGMVGAALTHDGVRCGVIADGVHVSAPALEVAWRCKGADRLMLVTDAMPSAGMADGSFRLGEREIVVRGGVCLDETGTLAGSSLDMASALRNMVAMTSADVPAASRMASLTPATCVGLSDRGRIAAGLRADLVALDAALHARHTWIGAQPAGRTSE